MQSVLRIAKNPCCPVGRTSRNKGHSRRVVPPPPNVAQQQEQQQQPEVESLPAGGLARDTPALLSGLNGLTREEVAELQQALAIGVRTGSINSVI